jgi:ComEC/Rec2-related protein
MNFYRRRPLALALSLGIVLSAASAFMQTSVKILILLLIPIIVAASALILKGRLGITISGMSARSFIALAGVISLVMLITSFAFYDRLLTGYECLAEEGKRCRIYATVTDVRYESGYRAVYTVRLRSVDGKSARVKGLLLSEMSRELSVGDTIECDVVFVPLGEVYSFYDMSKYDMMANGNYFACETDGELNLIGKMGGIEIFFSRLRGRLCASISLYLNKNASALSRALLLNDRSDLRITFISRDFSRIGASHILSLSGLHLTVLCKIIDVIALKLSAPKKLRSSLTILFVIFYMLLTAFPYSVVRAGIMVILLQCISLFGFDRDSITALFMAGALILLCNPPAFFDIGFEMSFMATLGVLVMSDDANKLLHSGFRRITQKFMPAKYLRSAVLSLIVTFGAVMFIIPLQWLHFGETSLMTPKSTLLITPFCGLLLWLLPFYMIASAAGFSFTAGRIGWLVTLLSEAIVRLASKLAHRNTLVSLKYHFVPPLIIIFSAVIIIMMCKNVRSWLWSLVPFSIMAALFFGCVGIYEHMRSDDRILSFVYDKSNDAFSLVIDGRGIITDISDGSVSLMKKAEKSLVDDNITEIDTCLLTHLHRRHAVSLRSLCESRLVRRFLLPEPQTAAEEHIAADIIDLAAEAGAIVEYYTRPDEANIRLGDVDISVFKSSYIKRSTHPIISLKFGFDSVNVLYVGSSLWEANGSDEFIPNAGVVFYGSHGPKIKSYPNFTFSDNTIIFSTDSSFGGTQIIDRQRVYIKP